MNFNSINETGQQQTRLKRNQVSNFDNPEISTLKNMALQTYPDENQEIEPFHSSKNLSELSQGSIDIPVNDAHKFYPDFLGQDHSKISKLFFFQYTSYALKLKKQVLDQNLKITNKHLPALSPDDDLKQLVQRSQNQIQEIEEITSRTLIKLIFIGELKWITIKCILAYFIKTISKNGISFIMSFVIDSVNQNDQKYSYIYGIILIVLNFICLLSKHHAANYSMIFSTKARLSLINFVYIKLIGLNSYSFKQANIGKILNLISGDINTLEQMFSMIFSSSVVIISLFFACFILWNRFDGMIGLWAVLLIFIAYPIQILIQSFNQETLKQAKFNQDKRLKITNELIEGIRLIKMQAWEKAFQKIVMIIRQREFLCILKIFLRTAIDRLFTQTSHIWASILYFLILYYGDFKIEIKVAEMISTIQLLNSLKISCVYMVSNGIQAYIQNLKEYHDDDCQLQKNEIQKEDVRIQLNNFCEYWTSQVSEILNGLSFQIKSGYKIGCVGRTGAGKSSIYKIYLE